MNKKAISKRKLAHQLFQTNLQLFHCPICQQAFIPCEKMSMRCKSNHNFDLARSGYINFLSGQQHGIYDQELFRARRQIFASGIYQPLTEKIGEWLNKLTSSELSILDAGCGEGSFLARLSEYVNKANLIGIDISKEAIKMAGAFNRPIMWCVADLAQLPFSDHSLDVIINLLSPANYSEFRRVLKPKGVLIKILPGKGYLREIRTRLEGVEEYSNQDVLANLEANLNVTKRERLAYQVAIDQKLWSKAVQMTPLTQHRDVKGEPSTKLSIDLEIIWCET